MSTPAQREAAREEREYRIQEVAHLIRFEGDADQIARRAGFKTTKGAIRQLRHWGYPELSRALDILASNGDPYLQRPGDARMELPGLIFGKVPA